MTTTMSTSATSTNRSSSPQTIDLLLQRSSVSAAKQSTPGPSPEELETLLRCAIRVPDHGKLSPWRIQVVQGQAQRTLGALLAQVYQGNYADATEEQLAVERQRPCRAPLLLIVSTKIETDRISRWEQTLSGAAVCQNILIAATALGYASQWLTGWPAYDVTVKQALGIAPDDGILGFLYIGSATELPTERPRPSLADIVTYLE